MAFAIFSARIRIPLLAVAGLMILLGVVMDRLWVSNVGFVALIIGLALYFRVWARYAESHLSYGRLSSAAGHQ